eukprot:TRINITY_DN66208_c8_g2_i1.p1 TRINITY_DN66208_c8_g2~~TRINITY_DN66208_c8_g2_i1.p1  ORF type:complete len:513 (-),score=49.09 TRINITY_DN66208_c8_g2_i1:82-1620(-)
MLTLDETKSLVELLQSDEQPIQKILDQFHKAFKQEAHSRMAISLRCMLEDNYYNRTDASNNHAELLITHLLLWHLSRPNTTNKGDENCTLPNTKSVLYDQLQKVEANIRERRTRKENNKDKKTNDADWEEDEAVRINTILKFFILQCVNGEIKKEWLSKSPAEILALDNSQLDVEFNRFSSDNQDGLRERLRDMQVSFEEERKNSIGGFLAKGISPIISEPDDSNTQRKLTADVDGPSSSSTESKQQQLKGKYCTLGLRPNNTPLRHEPIYDRPQPPSLPTLPHEMMFLASEGYFSDLVMDSHLTSSAAFEVGELMQKAYQGKLNPDKCQQVVNTLKQHPSLLFKCGMSPERLQTLVENNSAVAEHFLVNILQTKYAKDFLDGFVSGGPTNNVHFRSAELVTRLANQGSLPKDFLLSYINHYVHVTNSTTSQAAQQRSVKILSLFVAHLIRAKVITDTDIYETSPELGAELHKFCLAFPKVKESTKLFKLLKSMDPHNADPGKKDALEEGKD